MKNMREVHVSTQLNNAVDKGRIKLAHLVAIDAFLKGIKNNDF
jgi:hypothetical protein